MLQLRDKNRNLTHKHHHFLLINVQTSFLDNNSKIFEKKKDLSSNFFLYLKTLFCEHVEYYL